MIIIVVSFICGITVFNFFPFFPFSITALCITALFVIYLFRDKAMLCLTNVERNKWRKFLIVFAFASGFLYSAVRYEPLPEIRLPQEEITVKGTISDVPEIFDGKIRFTIDDVNIDGKEIRGKVRLFFKIPDEIVINNSLNYLIPAGGDRINAAARLKEPSVFRNPGVYSYDFKKDGIVAVGYVSRLNIISRGSGLLSWIHKNRYWLGRIIDNSLSAKSASFHKAIIPGFKGGIDQKMRDYFSSTGLAHLLSISGTHFGLLAFIIFKTVKMIVRFLPAKTLNRMTIYITPTQVAVIVTIPVLLLYAAISGASTPAIRSFIMIFIYMLALFLGRRNQWLNSLSIAAIIILLWKPDALFELSFQLSFLAVLSIGLVLERKNQKTEPQSPLPTFDPSVSPLSKGGIKGGLGRIKKAFEGIKTSILITIAAVLGTAPLVALFFKQFPLISPVANLMVTPFVCFIILPLGFFAGFTALLFNMPLMPLNGLIDIITHFVLNLIKVFSDIPYSSFYVPNPSFTITVLYFLSLIFILRAKTKWRFLPLVFVLFIFILRPYLSSYDLRLTFLDVGQGDALLVELPDKRVMLIDGGAESSESGQRVIAPYLWSKGIRSIDNLVLSHPHYDHFGGLIYILDNFDVKEVWLNGRSVQGSEVFFTKIKDHGIPYKVLKRGDLLDRGIYQILVLHPYDEFFADSPRGAFSNENNDSLVLKIDTGNFSVLFTGDIEIEAEEDIMHLSKWLRSDIMKVPHHGGKTSSKEEFIKAVNPEVAVASAGRYNSFNHPHVEALKRYEGAGVRFYRTDNDGAVIVTLKDGRYSVKTYHDSRFKRVVNLYDEMRNLRLLL